MFVLLFLMIFKIPSSFEQQQRFIGNNITSRYPYICGSDPYRFYSEFPCYLYPICINGGFQLNVGCAQDYQCTPYSVDAVCVNSCCCTVPKLVGQQPEPSQPPPPTTQRFFDNSSQKSATTTVFLTLLILIFHYCV